MCSVFCSEFKNSFFGLLFCWFGHGNIFIIEVIISDWLHIFIELEDEWSSVWNPKTQDLCVVNSGQGLDHTSEHMLMGYVEDSSIFAFLFEVPERLAHLLMPVWSNPLSDHLEWLTSGHLLMLWLCEVLVQLIKSWVTSHTRIIIVDKWRRVIVRLPPKLDLIVSVFLGSLLLA